MENQGNTAQDKLNNISPISFRKQENEVITQPITIGLDFGTATTKCVINIEGSYRPDRYLAMLFPATPESTLFYPTAVGFRDGHFFFGDLATKLPENETIYSCKMAIPCNSSWNNYRSPFVVDSKPGFFRFGNNEISATELSILYLSNVIRLIKENIKRAFPNSKAIYYLNMACPLDQLRGDYLASCAETDKQAACKENRVRDEYIEKCYTEISQFSLILSEDSANPWDSEKAICSLKNVQQQRLTSQEKSPASIIPETLAAIASFIKRPGTEQGRYITIDVGAGTTDISVFWLRKDPRNSTPYYYSSGSLHIGVDQIDMALKEILKSYDGISLRDKREKLMNDSRGLSHYKSQINQQLFQMLAHRRSCFGRAYYKESKQSVWGDRTKTNLTMIMCGGGSKLDVIEEIFTESEIWQSILGRAKHVIPEIETCNHALTPNVGLIDIYKNVTFRKNSSLLLIAEGLASKVIEIPEYGIQTRRIHIPKRGEEEYNGNLSEGWTPGRVLSDNHPG